MEWRGSWSFQHIQGKAFRISHFEKTWFHQSFHSTHWLECSWYWCYSWPTLMRMARNMLSPIHPEIIIRLKTTTLHMRGNVWLLYGPLYILGPIFMAPSSLCILTTSLSSGWWPMINLLVLVGCLYFRNMSSRLFIDLVLHIKTRIPCCKDPSLPLKIY